MGSTEDTKVNTLQNTINILENKLEAVKQSNNALDNFWKQTNTEFNKNINLNNNEKNKIMTSNRIINMQEEEYEMKVFYSSLFVYFLIYIIVLCVLFKIRVPLGMPFSLFGTLVGISTAILILMIIKAFIQKNNILLKITHPIDKALSELKNDSIANAIDEILGCPSTCPSSGGNQSSNNYPDNQYTIGEQMNTDLTTNVWEYGDRTGSVGIKSAYPPLPESLLKKPELDNNGDPKKDSNTGETIYKDNPLTQYTCYWNGELGNGINPNNNTLKTTVPCEHIPGYSYVSKGL